MRLNISEQEQAIQSINDYLYSEFGKGYDDNESRECIAVAYTTDSLGYDIQVNVDVIHARIDVIHFDVSSYSFVTTSENFGSVKSFLDYLSVATFDDYVSGYLDNEAEADCCW